MKSKVTFIQEQSCLRGDSNRVPAEYKLEESAILLGPKE